MLRDRKDRADEVQEKIKLSLSELKYRSDDWEKLSKKVELSKTSWLLAGISGPLNLRIPLPERPESYTAVCSDGSQIFPDRHESLHCYLINISSVTLSYGEDAGASLRSYPELFFRDEDTFTLWDGKKMPATSEVISLRRTLMEIEKISKLAGENSGRANKIALCDGTLILWRLEAVPPDFKNSILEPFLKVMDEFKSNRVPVAGYISFPGSTDVINALRLGLCPEEISYCNQCPYTELPELPCSPIEGLTDRVLFSRILDEGERSAVFRSSSKILDKYGGHRVYFFYLDIGQEIARVEVPEWVAVDGELLSEVHTLVFDQAKKGGGYPASLSEAHEQAVVKGKDREFFLQLIREALVGSGLRVSASRKGLSKRVPGI